MDFSWLGPVLQTGGGLLSEAMTSGDREDIRKRLAKALAEYNGLEVPDLPTLQAELLGPSAYEQINVDPRFAREQTAGLDALDEIARQGGLTLADKAALEEQLSSAARSEQAQRQGLAADFARRGQLGGGQQLAMSLQNQSEAAERGHRGALDTAANAQRRYYQSVLDKGRMAGQMQDADFRRQADVARARDVISQHNAASRMDANRYNAGLPAQRFNMQRGLASDRANAQMGMANYDRQDVDAKQGQIAGAFGAGAKGVEAWQQKQRADEEMEMARRRAQREQEDHEARMRLYGGR
jgi:hypothetical protein